MSSLSFYVQKTTNLTSCHLLVGFENGLVLWLGNVVALSVESALRVGGVVDDLQLARLVVVAIPGNYVSTSQVL